MWLSYSLLQAGSTFFAIFCFRILATRCNSGLFRRGARATLAAIPTDLEASHDNVEPAVPLDLPFEPVEKIALEFRDLAATQARHMNVVTLGAPFIVVFLSLQMHEVEFVDQSMTF